MAKVSRKGFSPRKNVFELNYMLHFSFVACKSEIPDGQSPGSEEIEPTCTDVH